MKFPKFSGDDFESQMQAMQFLIENLIPEFADGQILIREPSEEEWVGSLDPRRVWTEVQLDETTITNGFLPASGDDRVGGYYVCEVECENEPVTVFIKTEILLECEECEGEGVLDDDDCEKCEGEGSYYRYLNEIWKGL